MDPSIIKRLQEETAIEKKQKNLGKFVEDYPENARGNEQYNFTLRNSYFFNNKDVYISKHNRYADYPVHTHQFLEMNYMLTGSCQQIVNGEPIELQANDLLLLDIDCKHEIKRLDKEDIMINILFPKKNISISWLNNLKRSNSLLYDFLLSTFYGNQNTKKYILFENGKNTEMIETLDHIIEEYFNKKTFFNEVLSSYLHILLTQLVRNYKIKRVEKMSHSQSVVVQVLKDIENEYQELTLEQCAKKYGYNKNYLSNILKKETGKSFNTLLTQQRMINAHLLLSSTTYNTNDIMSSVGISNKTFFYEKYKEYYHELPGETRKNKQRQIEYQQ